jgi:hypothetical protein
LRLEGPDFGSVGHLGREAFLVSWGWLVIGDFGAPSQQTRSLSPRSSNQNQANLHSEPNHELLATSKCRYHKDIAPFFCGLKQTIYSSYPLFSANEFTPNHKVSLANLPFP